MILRYYTFMNSQSEKIVCFFIFIHSFFNMIFIFLCFVFSIFSYLSFILVVTAQLAPELDNQSFEEFFKMETDELEEIMKVNDLINDSIIFDDIVNLEDECSMFSDSIFFDDLVEIEEQSMINFYFDLQQINQQAFNSNELLDGIDDKDIETFRSFAEKPYICIIFLFINLWFCLQTLTLVIFVSVFFSFFYEFFKMETDELEEITKVNHLINDSKTFDDIVNLKNECSMFNDSIFFDDLVEIEEQSMINFYFDLDFIWSYVLFIILKVVCTFFQKLYKHCNSC